MTTVIAVVEDDPDQRENYSDVLTAHGYEVRTYPDRPTAEAAFNLELPDLAMLDIMLGEGKGNAARNRADAAYECEVDLEYYLRHGPQGINAAGRAARRARRE